jgi:Major Facilitator Superfamily
VLDGPIFTLLPVGDKKGLGVTSHDSYRSSAVRRQNRNDDVALAHSFLRNRLHDHDCKSPIRMDTFVNPIAAKHDWSIAAIQLAFSIFVAVETWLTPVEAWLVDLIGPRFGSKLMVAAGGVLVAFGWGLNAYADTLMELYIASAVAGIGRGAIYATCVGLAVKWFPDCRGLAVGLTAVRRRCGADGYSDRAGDQDKRLRSSVFVVRPSARGRGVCGRVASAGARTKRVEDH